MSKQRKSRVIKSKTILESTEDAKRPSFDLDTVLCIAATMQILREEIENLTIEKAQVKKCIPKEVAIKVIQELGLKKYLPNEFRL